MNTYTEVIEGFRIFMKYEHRCNMSPDHDVIYAGPSPEIVSEEDTKTLENLGWTPHFAGGEGICFHLII